MNAKCHCSHPLSAHHVTAGCGRCGCTKFTEAASYRCLYCDEPILIEFAPNEDILRIKFKDDGKNYAHAKCHKDQANKPAITLPAKPLLKPAAAWDENRIIILKKDAAAIVALFFKLDLLDQEGNCDSSKVTDEEAFAIDALVSRLDT